MVTSPTLLLAAFFSIDAVNSQFLSGLLTRSLTSSVPSFLRNPALISIGPSGFAAIAPDGSTVGLSDQGFGGASRDAVVGGSGDKTGASYYKNGRIGSIARSGDSLSGFTYNTKTGEISQVGGNGKFRAYQSNFVRNSRRPATTRTQSNCGYSRFASPFIIGGEEAARGEWPWFASLFVSEGSDARRLKLLCGATLVSVKHVVTAAHCIELPNEPHRYTLMLGRHNIAVAENENFQSLKVTRLVIHPEYATRRFSADADIAVLKLQRAATLSDRVQPACLPKSDLSDSKVLLGTVVGYGKSNRIDEHTNVPRKINVGSINLVACLYSDPAFGKIASKRTFCGAGIGKSPCKGDSGGGFYVRDAKSGLWTFNGIVSEGIITNGFCDVQKYVVFVDVSKFLPWISQTLQNLSSDPCDPFPCGKNADCFIFGDTHFCACKSGLKGDPQKECRK